MTEFVPKPTQADIAKVRDNEDDPEMRALAAEERDAAADRLAEIERRLKVLLLPRDEADTRNAISQRKTDGRGLPRGARRHRRRGGGAVIDAMEDMMGGGSDQ